MSRYGWLLQLPNPRRNQYKPWFICLHVLTINEYAEVGKLQRICYYKWDAGVMSRGVKTLLGIYLQILYKKRVSQYNIYRNKRSIAKKQ